MTQAITTVTFLSVGNPTGLKFTVEHGEARALFDFGREHAPGRALFSTGLEPRRGRELADLRATGIAPELKGVYEEWDGRTSAFISHLHLDHTALVEFLNPQLPLFYPAGMEAVRAAAVEAGHLGWREPVGTPIPDRGRVRVGEIEVEFVAVDHDVPGASGFLITTPDLRIAFTGDHRWHGPHPEVTARYADLARGADVLIQEGVMLGIQGPTPPAGELQPPPPLSEREVWSDFEKLLGERRGGLVVVNSYPMNRERLWAFGEACARAGRRFLMEPRAARIAGWEGVWSELTEVAADPSGHCIQLGFEELPALIDLRPPPGSVYVHSNGIPGGGFDPAWPVMEGWVSHFGLDLVRLPSTGHSFTEDIVRMVQTVAPGIVLPVHSRFPEALQVQGIPSLLVEPLRHYTAGDLKAPAAS